MIWDEHVMLIFTSISKEGSNPYGLRGRRTCMIRGDSQLAGLWLKHAKVKHVKVLQAPVCPSILNIRHGDDTFYAPSASATSTVVSAL